jgi:hypothetical protein
VVSLSPFLGVCLFTTRHDTTYITHHANVYPDSLRRYSYPLAGAVILVLRNHAHPSSHYSFVTPQAIRTASESLIRAFEKLKSGNVAESPPPDEEDDDEEPDFSIEPPEEEQDDEEFITHIAAPQASDLLEDPENLDPPSEFQPIIEPSPLPTVAKTHQPPPFLPVIQTSLRNLLFALFSQLSGPEASGQFFSPLFRYLVLISLHINGRWEVANKITQYIAALLFTGRLTLYSETHLAVQGQGHYNYHT